MEIYVYKGSSDLPSIDFDCLRALTYIRLTQAPVKIIHNGNPKNSSTGYLPYLTDGQTNDKICGYPAIIDYLKDKGFDINKLLSNNDVHVSLGLIQYAYTKVNPAFQYIFFGNPLNVADATLLYAQQIRFPFNMYYPKKYIGKAHGILEVMSDIDVDDKIDNKEVEDIIFTAKTCITFLARKLEKELWFLKAQPTEFDITVYAYLALLTKIKLPNNQLESHILEFPNLANYIDRINKKYFSDDIFKFDDIQKRSKSSSSSSGTNSKSSDSGTDENKESRKTQIISLVCAALAMIGFAISKGILSFSYQADDKYIEYYEDEDNEEEEYN